MVPEILIPPVVSTLPENLIPPVVSRLQGVSGLLVVHTWEGGGGGGDVEQVAV